MMDDKAEPELSKDTGESGPAALVEDDLERRLAMLALDVRKTAAEEMQKRREQSVLEAREYVDDVKPSASKAPDGLDVPKIMLARGVDPQQDPTLVGRRNGPDEWAFGVAPDPSDEPAPTGESRPDEPDEVRGKSEALRRGKWAVLVAAGIVSCTGIAVAAQRHIARTRPSPLEARHAELSSRMEEASYKATLAVAAGALNGGEEAKVMEEALVSVPPVDPASSVVSARPRGRPGPKATIEAAPQETAPLPSVKRSNRGPIGKGPVY